jgi:NAD+ kinase
MTATLDEVFAGHYVREPRLLLAARIEYIQPDTGPVGPFFALNDVVVRNKQFARVLEFDTFMDDTFISHHRADGIIVASPTGSTAYALSGGGPVLHPALTAIALVPICPHTLSDRPLVIDARHRIEVVVGPEDDTQAVFTADGQMNQTLCAGDRVLIERADHDLTLIHPPGYDYFKILRNKLHWGRGQRILPPNT